MFVNYKYEHFKYLAPESPFPNNQAKQGSAYCNVTLSFPLKSNQLIAVMRSFIFLVVDSKSHHCENVKCHTPSVNYEYSH
jgi:hypothetical protein